MEKWKEIPGSKGKYQVSSNGYVKSLNYNKTGKEKIMKSSSNAKGYQFLHLYLDGERKTVLVHRLVWEVFNGPIPENMQIGHLNENNKDNRLENLKLMTASENNNWGTRTKKASSTLTNHKRLSKPVLQYDLNGNFIRRWPSVIEVERELGYSNAAIGACCRGAKYCHTCHGYKWKYEEAI